MKPSLPALITPHPVADFTRAYEAGVPFVVHGLSDSIRELTSLPFLSSLDAMLNSWPLQVEAHLPKITDEANAVQVSTRDAKVMFENGMGLLFSDVHLISPLLNEWLEGLRSNLGLSALTIGRNLVYATKGGKGTSPHFDQNMNFVIQVHGTKKWWVAPNTHVVNPLTRYTIGVPMDTEMAGYVEAPMPTAMPSGAEAFILEPGSMLFVPRGSWHRTEAVTEALSLNFTFSAPTWIDMFSAVMRARLAQSPEWRETAQLVSDLISDPARAQLAIEKFNTLLSELSFEAPEWRAENFLAITEADSDIDA